MPELVFSDVFSAKLSQFLSLFYLFHKIFCNFLSFLQVNLNFCKADIRNPLRHILNLPLRRSLLHTLFRHILPHRTPLLPLPGSNQEYRF